MLALACLDRGLKQSMIMGSASARGSGYNDEDVPSSATKRRCGRSPGKDNSFSRATMAMHIIEEFRALCSGESATIDLCAE